MSIIYMLGLCAGGFALYCAAYCVHSLFFHPIARFPGPRLWAVSRIPWAYHTVKGDIWQVLSELHEQYGPMIRIAPNELTTILPEAWKDVYATKPLLLKDPYSQTQPLNGAESLFTAEGNTHRRLRAVLSNSFSENALRSQSTIIEKYASQLVDRIVRESAEGTKEVDLTKLYGYTVFDTITDLSLGEALCRSLENLNEHSWIQGYFLHAKFTGFQIALSRFAPLDAILGFFLLGITGNARQRNWQVVGGALDRRMARRDSGNMIETRSDLLTPLVDRLDEQGQKGITKAEMFTNGLAFVIAGTQLNGSVASTAMYLLLRHRSKWDQVVEEVRSRFSNVKEITVQATRDLRYLEAVINETLRIRHPTPITLPRVVPATGCCIGGHAIPGDIIVGVNLQNIQNASMLWVEPREFHPERFLDPKDPRYETRFDADSKEAFAPFSVGPRNCIGHKLFFAQVRVLLAKVAWKFEISSSRAADEDWMNQKAWFAFEPRELLVKVVSRLETVD